MESEVAQNLESPEHQEMRSRRHVRYKAVVKSFLIAGTIFFIIFPQGSPWNATGPTGLPDAIMGRQLGLPFIVTTLLHYFVAFVYTLILAFAIYRLRIFPAIMLGGGMGFVLYGLNFLLFRNFSGVDRGIEIDTLITHVVFCLVASAAYKALSVPRPRRTDRETPVDVTKPSAA